MTITSAPSPATLASLDVAGPRYTSYPTADRFSDRFGGAAYVQALGECAEAAAATGGRPLGLYVHLPFCASVCYYCACNKIVTRNRAQGDEYLDALAVEIGLVVRAVGRAGLRFSQLHLGGGTPTFHDDAHLAKLAALLERSFEWTDDAERAIEVDPRTVDAARLRALATIGFNRLSFGVQDFDPDVQSAIHRVQPFERVAELMAEARRIGFRGINVDLIYGLPMQSAGSFARTLAQVNAIRPDRVALYAYAHLPGRFKPQRRIDARSLPGAAEKTAMLALAVESLLDKGYEYIGMDHFALAGDPLAAARRSGTLQRNFQGYTAQPDGDLIGLGVSAIGKVGDCYAQNEKTLAGYYAALRVGRFPTARGLRLDADDLLRRDVIMALMCQGRVDHAAIEAAHGVVFAGVFAAELERLRPLEALGLVEIEEGELCVTPAGRYVVRAVAMVFDRHLAADGGSARYSRVV